MITSEIVARAIVSETNKRSYSIGSVKLHKLLYVVFGLYILNIDEAPFDDDYPMTFPYGPLFPNIQFKIKSEKINLKENDFILQSDEEIDRQKCENLNVFIKNACDILGEYSATKLSNWSHRKSSAWSRTMSDNISSNVEDTCTLINKKYIIEEMEVLSHE